MKVILYIVICSVMTIWGASAYAVSDRVAVTFKGFLYPPPCTVDLDSKNITIEFGTVIDAGLLKDGRNYGQPLIINFSGCEKDAINKPVIFGLYGTPSTADSKFLAVKDNPDIEIGFEDGVFGPNFPINKSNAGSLKVLSEGPYTIKLNTYVKPTQAALNDNFVRLGSFSASVYFIVKYE